MRRAARIIRRANALVFGSCCYACGLKRPHDRFEPISDELAETWEIDTKWRKHFNEREGLLCTGCGNNLRSQHMAMVITEQFRHLAPQGTRCLASLTASKEFAGLTVAEINSCGSLHQFLSRHPALFYSEYCPPDPSIRSENLLSLSYRDYEFDLVLTSETLEHVPDVVTALKEIYRILREGGKHIFTVPIVWGRKTRIRAKMTETGVLHTMPPSYHGDPLSKDQDFLVWYEFGDDLIQIIESIGFACTVVKHKSNPAICTFVTVKPANKRM